MAYTLKQRKDKGFDFFNGDQKITIDQYTQAQQLNKNTLVQNLAQRGDVVSQQAVRQPGFTVPKTAINPMQKLGISQPTLAVPKANLLQQAQIKAPTPAPVAAPVVNANPTDNYSQAPTIETRAKTLQQGINKKLSMDQLSSQTGLTKPEIAKYTDQYAKGYGAQHPVEAVGSFLGDMANNAAGLVRKPITTAMTAVDPKAKQAINSTLNTLNESYKNKFISQAKLQEEVTKLTGDQIGSGVVVDASGVRQGGAQEQAKQALLGGFQQGIDTASVLPAGNAVIGAQVVGGLTKDVALNILKRNAAQSLVYGTTSTANDLAQGRGVSPESLLANFGAPLALGSASEVAGVVAKPAIDAAGRVVKSAVTTTAKTINDARPSVIASQHPSVVAYDAPHTQMAQVLDTLQQGSPERLQLVKEMAQNRIDQANTAKGIQRQVSQAGFMGLPGKNPTKIHPEDQAIMSQLIDHARGITKLSPSDAYNLELNASRVADYHGIKQPNSLSALANQFDKRLTQDAAQARPKVPMTRQQREGGFAKIPGKAPVEPTPQVGKTVPTLLDKTLASKPAEYLFGDKKIVQKAQANGRAYLTLKENGLVPSSSAVRSYDQATGQQAQRGRGNQPQTLDTRLSNQNRSLLNNTPETSTVKLNTDRLNPDSGYAGLAEMSKQTTEVVEKLSNKDVQRIAKSAGIDTVTHSPERIKQKIAEQLNVRQDAVRYMNESESARRAGDNAQAEALMFKAAEQGRISRAQGSELGQQLQARKIIANELDTPQQRIFKLLDAAGINPEAYVKRLAMVDFADAKQVMEAYRDLVPAKASEWLDVLRYNSMLSSPLTQVVNIFGNSQNISLVAPIEKTIRGTLDAIGGAFGKERKYAAGEGMAYMQGSTAAIGDATRNFVDALRGTGKYSNPDLETYNIPLATKGISGGVYKTMSFPMRVLDGMDKFFRTMATAGEDKALTLRDKKGISLGGNKTALLEGEASYRVFQQESHTPGQGVVLDAFDGFADIVMSGRNSKNPILSTVSKFTIPFVKTINNINKQGMVEYSPLGIINLVGNTDKVTAITRATMGTAVFGISATLIGGGNMTWGEPRNAEERARFRAEGKQPYSVKVGDTWYNFSKLTPSISFPMAMAAALDDALKAKKTDQSAVDSILEAVSKYGNFMADQSYAKTIGDTLAALGGDREAMASMVSGNIQQLIPFRAFTGWIARMSDDKERKVDTSQSYYDQQVQLVMQQYPGLRQKTGTRDYRGDPIMANNQVVNAFSPVRATTDRGVNSVDTQLDALKTEVDPLLDKKQIKQLANTVNSKLPTAQETLIQTSDFKNLSDADKKSRLTKLATDIKAVERRKLMVDGKIGEYAADYTGKVSKLTKDQTSMLSGNIDIAKYSKSGEVDTKLNTDSLSYKLLDSSSSRSTEDKKTWLQEKVSDEYQPLVDNINKALPADMPKLPATNAVAELYATFEKDKADGNWSKLQTQKEAVTLVKNSYKSLLSDNEQFISTLSDAEIVSAVGSGDITKAEIDNIMGLDNTLSMLGATPTIGAKTRAKLGYGTVAKSKNTSKSSGKKGKAGFKAPASGGFKRTSSTAAIHKLLSSAGKNIG